MNDLGGLAVVEGIEDGLSVFRGDRNISAFGLPGAAALHALSADHVSVTTWKAITIFSHPRSSRARATRSFLELARRLSRGGGIEVRIADASQVFTQ